jgi:hypothetical protein
VVRTKGVHEVKKKMETTGVGEAVEEGDVIP